MSIRAKTAAVTSAPSGGAEQRLQRVLTLGLEKLNLGNAAAATTGVKDEQLLRMLYSKTREGRDKRDEDIIEEAMREFLENGGNTNAWDYTNALRNLRELQADRAAREADPAAYEEAKRQKRLQKTLADKVTEGGMRGDEDIVAEAIREYEEAGGDPNHFYYQDAQQRLRMMLHVRARQQRNRSPLRPMKSNPR